LCSAVAQYLAVHIMAQGYPHLYDHPIGRMPCAKAENKMTATGLFTDICPSGYIIDEVYPLSSKKKPYCRWSVKFIKDNEEELPPPVLGDPVYLQKM
jgi:hypothetical protein